MRALVLGLAAAAAPVLAQTATPAAPGATPIGKAVAEGANNRPTPSDVQAGVGTPPPTPAQMAAAVDKGQYEADRLAYRNAVIARNIAIAHDRKRYELQQDRYARAMAAWRAQVAACKAGDKAGCEQPQPDPAGFY